MKSFLTRLKVSPVASHTIHPWLWWLCFLWSWPSRNIFLLLDVDKLWDGLEPQNLLPLVVSVRLEPQSLGMRNVTSVTHSTRSPPLIQLQCDLHRLTIQSLPPWSRRLPAQGRGSVSWAQLWRFNKPCDQWRTGHKASLWNLERNRMFTIVK